METPARKEPKGKGVLRVALPNRINPIPTKAAIQIESISDKKPNG